MESQNFTFINLYTSLKMKKRKLTKSRLVKKDSPDRLRHVVQLPILLLPAEQQQAFWV